MLLLGIKKDEIFKNLLRRFSFHNIYIILIKSWKSPRVIPHRYARFAKRGLLLRKLCGYLQQKKNYGSDYTPYFISFKINFCFLLEVTNFAHDICITIQF